MVTSNPADSEDLSLIRDIMIAATRHLKEADEHPTLEELIKFVGAYYDLDKNDFEEMRKTALANPSAARESFLTLWSKRFAEKPEATSEAGEKISCLSCARLECGLSCNAARHGEIAGAPAKYFPDLKMSRACPSYKTTRMPVPFRDEIHETTPEGQSEVKNDCHPHDMSWVKKRLSEQFPGREAEALENYHRLFREARDLHSDLPEYQRDGAARQKANQMFLDNRKNPDEGEGDDK